MLNRVTVRIAGLNHTIVGEESEAYIRKIADMAQRAIKEAHNQAHGSTLEAAVLTVLNLTDENYRMKTEEVGLREEVSRCTDEAEKLRRQAHDAVYERDVLQEQLRHQEEESARALEEAKAECARLRKEANDAKAELGRLRAAQHAGKGGN